VPVALASLQEATPAAINCPCWAGAGDYCGKGVNLFAKKHGCVGLPGQDDKILSCTHDGHANNDQWTVHISCPYGCVFSPNGAPDYCKPPPPPPPRRLPRVDTVFLIVMENHNWSQIAGNSNAPFINDSLLPMSSYATRYYNNLGGLHPSEPNYLWLVSGYNFNIWDDADPSAHNISSHQHLMRLLDEADISWRAYQEDATDACPMTSTGLYAAKHDPFVYFTDVTNDQSYCAKHLVSLAALDQTLTATCPDTIPRFNFITPNLCNDMHGAAGCPTEDPVAVGDAWLAQYIPKIMASPVYQEGRAAIFITWDEDEPPACADQPYGDCPIGMIVVSPLARGHGYHNSIYYTHSSLLLTLQEIFGVAHRPLGDAANWVNLSDLFK
jgi:hypothetical protein